MMSLEKWAILRYYFYIFAEALRRTTNDLRVADPPGVIIIPVEGLTITSLRLSSFPLMLRHYL